MRLLLHLLLCLFFGLQLTQAQTLPDTFYKRYKTQHYIDTINADLKKNYDYDTKSKIVNYCVDSIFLNPPKGDTTFQYKCLVAYFYFENMLNYIDRPHLLKLEDVILSNRYYDLYITDDRFNHYPLIKVLLKGDERVARDSVRKHFESYRLTGKADPNYKRHCESLETLMLILHDDKTIDNVFLKMKSELVYKRVKETKFDLKRYLDLQILEGVFDHRKREFVDILFDTVIKNPYVERVDTSFGRSGTEIISSMRLSMLTFIFFKDNVKDFPFEIYSANSVREDRAYVNKRVQWCKLHKNDYKLLYPKKKEDL